MVDTEIEHFNHPDLFDKSKYLKKFGPTTSVKDILEYIYNTTGPQSLYESHLQIKHLSNGKYYMLNDQYIQEYKPFFRSEYMLSTEVDKPQTQLVEIRVMWRKKNNDDKHKTDQNIRQTTIGRHSSQFRSAVYLNMYSFNYSSR